MFDKYQYQSNIGTGIAFLFNRNLQLNSSFRLLADGKSSGFYSSLGASYRLDRHVDKVLNEDKKSKSIKNKGFFGKKGFLDNLTNKFKNLFRKKGKRVSTKKSSLKKETIQSINNNNATNKENLEEKSLRVKPIRRRISPSKIKEEKDKTKKGFFNILKTRKKDEKQDSEKNTKELEKEIKNLEKEVKKDNKKLKRERKKEEAEKKKKEKASKKRKSEVDDDNDDENDLN